jgi:glycosyltransferase involved in cell wall biosynthesis
VIGLLHGYLLEGSGSNLWTRLVVQALCRSGHTVHLVCQEPHPEVYDFIADAFVYRADDTVETRVSRDVPYAGRCVAHQPELGATLPVYVWDEYEEFERVVPMVDLPDAEIEAYIARNAAVVERVVREHGITVLQANHVVLMSVVAQRVSRATGVPYFVMPHGSAIEYAARPDPRLRALAAGALADARGVLVSAAELGDRVHDLFPDVPSLAGKLAEVRVGVDTRGFQPIPRGQRPASIEVIADLLRPLPRGRTPDQTRALFDALVSGAVHDAAPGAGTPDDGGRDDAALDAASPEAAPLEAAIAEATRYDGKAPDVGAEDALRGVDWVADRTILFVGRIIAAKGVHCVVAALPEILRAEPRARLVVAGHGPLREPLEVLLHALATGDRALAHRIAEGGGDGGLERMAGVPEYWAALAREDRLDDYFHDAARLLGPDSVVFTGYFTHRELVRLFPCCDVGVFPSMVRESGPMVFLEALASGCFPVGSYFAGTRDKIDTVAPFLPPDIAALMKVRPDPAHLAADLARVVPRALDAGPRHAATLRRVAEEEYDWAPIARRLARALLGDGK